MRYKLLILGVTLMLLSAVGFSSAFAATYLGDTTLNCNGWYASFSGPLIKDRDNTGNGQEAMEVRIFDGAGTLIYFDSAVGDLGVSQFGIGGSGTYDTAPQYNPLTLQLVSLAGNGLAEEVSYEYVGGNCADLPLFNTGSSGGGSTLFARTGRCPNIPAGSVVGRVMSPAQVYWKPSEVSPGVSLNAGMDLWVVGVDESGEFYQVILSCNYIWVPFGTMGTSPNPPWNSAPLPTTVVG